MENGKSPSLIEDGKVIKCKTEHQVPLVAVSCKFQVPDHQERRVTKSSSMYVPNHCSHMVPERLQLFKEGLSGEPPDSKNVGVEQLVVGPERENTCELTSCCVRRKVQETKHKDANRQALCSYTFS